MCFLCEFEGTQFCIKFNYLYLGTDCVHSFFYQIELPLPRHRLCAFYEREGGGGHPICTGRHMDVNVDMI